MFPGPLGAALSYFDLTTYDAVKLLWRSAVLLFFIYWIRAKSPIVDFLSGDSFVSGLCSLSAFASGLRWRQKEPIL